MYRKNSCGAWTLMLVTAVAMLLIVGCSSTSKKEETPAGSTLTLSASPTSLSTGATTVVEAALTNGGAGVADAEITFTVTPSSAGYFTPAMDTTDGNGLAATVFTATTSGPATVTAAVNGSNLTRTVGLTVQAGGGQTGSGNVNVTVTPSLLLANGTDVAQVRITVRDALGQFAPESTMVKLTAGEKFVDKDGNGYWSAGIDSLVYDANANGTWDALGLIPSTAFVGDNGLVTVNFTAGNDAMTVYIHVTVEDNGITGFAEVPLQLSPDAAIASIFLASDSINLVVKQTGGIESAVLQAICYDQNTNTVPEGLTVNFAITDGPGGGEHLANTGYGPYQAVTNSQGIATVSIHSGTRSGTIRVRAWADTVLSNATQVMVSAGPPAHIVVGADTCNVPYWNVVAGVNGIVAVVSDVYLNPVTNNTAVYFTTDEGSMKSHEARTMDLEGIVETKWFSGNNVDTADGIVKVICETSGGTVADTSFFYNSGPAAYVEIEGNPPTSMLADGRSKADVTISGWDVNHNPMVNGTIAKAKATHIVTKDGILTDGCASTHAVMELVSAKLDQDYILSGANDNGVGAIDLVTFRVGFATASFPCSLLTGFASRTNSSINGPASVDTSQTVDYSVSIKDRWGNPLGDHTLVMTATGGTVTGATHETDGYGEAFGFRWKAPAVAGPQTITITDTDPRGGIVLTMSVTVSGGE